MSTEKDVRPKVCGVVEGFYGRPWTFVQRKQLFDRMKSLEMNTYLYAPKDDLKHRQMWRQLYSTDEAAQLKLLIDSAKINNVMFVYAISPGLDITFSNEDDIGAIKLKMKQVMKLGCDAFAILFDDIDPNLNVLDKEKFDSLAIAQVTLTNELFVSLNRPKFFLFCPTEYCATRAVPSVLTSNYLNIIGNKLEMNIDIMWTGPKVISKSLTIESIDELSQVLQRYPVIWDNLHANDYDQKRLFIGPYCGRSTKLLAKLRGVLTNPNCEFEANYIPVHTLGSWFKFGTLNKEYDALNSLEDALQSWMIHIYETSTFENEAQQINTLSNCVEASNSNIIPTKSVAQAMLATAVGSLPPSTASIAVAATQLLSHEACTAAVMELQQQDSSGGGANNNFISSSSDISSNRDTSVATAAAVVQVIDNAANSSASNEPGVSTTTALAVASVVQHAAQQEAMEICEAEYIQEVLQHEMLHSLKEKTEENPEDFICESQNKEETNSLKKEDNQMQVDEVLPECMEVSTTNGYQLSAESPVDTTSSTHSERLSIAQLRLLVDLCYLPYEHGSQAIKLLELVHWLRSHAHLVDRDDESEGTNEEGSIVNNEQPTHWRMKAFEFHSAVDGIRDLVNRFCAIPNKAVLSDFYSYLQDIRHVLESLDSYIRWLECAKVSYKNVCALRRLLSWCTPGYKEMFTGDDYESWMFRGGLIAEFQRMFPIDNAYDIFPIRASFILYPSDFSVNGLLLSSYETASNQIPSSLLTSQQSYTPMSYNVRPYNHETDKCALYALCYQLVSSRTHLVTSDLIGADSYILDLISTLPGDRYIGAYLDYCPEFCLILENNDNVIVGYAMGCLAVSEFEMFRCVKYRQMMLEKYWNLIEFIKNCQICNDSILTIRTMLEFFSVKWTSLTYSVNSILIHFDIREYCKPYDLDTIDSLARKLLICLVSAFKTVTAEVNDLNYPAASVISSTSIQNAPSIAIVTQATLIATNSVPFISIGPLVQITGKDRAPLISLSLYAEVDGINSAHKDIYKRYGFSELDINTSSNNNKDNSGNDGAVASDGGAGSNQESVNPSADGLVIGQVEEEEQEVVAEETTDDNSQITTILFGNDISFRPTILSRLI